MANLTSGCSILQTNNARFEEDVPRRVGISDHWDCPGLRLLLFRVGDDTMMGDLGPRLRDVKIILCKDNVLKRLSCR